MPSVIFWSDSDCITHIRNECPMSCTYEFLWCSHPNNFMWKVQIIKVLSTKYHRWYYSTCISYWFFTIIRDKNVVVLHKKLTKCCTFPEDLALRSIWEPYYRMLDLSLLQKLEDNGVDIYDNENLFSCLSITPLWRTGRLENIATFCTSAYMVMSEEIHDSLTFSRYALDNTLSGP
jgi:hypothetical protein